MSSTTSARSSRPSRVARWLGRGLAWLCLGLVLLIALVLMSLNLTPAGGIVAGQVNRLLEPSFQGQLHLLRLGQIDFDGVTGTELEVRDAAGQTVLIARGVDVRLFWPGVVARLAAGSDPLRIPIRRVAIERLDVTVIDDGAGVPTLAHAFEPRQPPPDEPATPTSVVVERLTLASARIQGALESFSPIDVQLHGLKARLASDASGFQLGLEQLGLEARQLPQVERVLGRLSGEVLLPEAAPQPEPVAPVVGGVTTETLALRPAPPERRVLLEFAGAVAGSEAALSLRWVGEQILARLQAGELTPDTLQRLVPALDPSAPVALEVSVEGKLDDLGLDARLSQGSARVDAEGRLRGESPNTRLSLSVEASRVDLARLLPDMARTDLALRADAELNSTASGSRGSYRLVSEGSSFAGEALPAATLAGELELPAAQPLTTRGRLVIAEPGAGTALDYVFTSTPSGSRLRLFSTTELEHSSRLRDQLGFTARGSIAVRAELEPDADRLSAEATVRLRELRHPAAAAAELTASLLAEGALSAPDLRLRADARGVTAGGRRLSHVSLSAQGTPQRSTLHATVRGAHPERLELQATLSPRAAPQLSQPRLRVSDGDDELLIAARSVGFDAGRLRVDDLSLDGAGQAELSLVYGRALEQLDLRTRALDAARLLRMFGVNSPLRSAWADLDVRVSNRGRQPRGTLVATVRQIGYAELAGSLRADLGFEQGKLDGNATFELTPGGTTEVSVRAVRVPLGPLRPGDLERLGGDIALKGEVDLSRLQSLLPLADIERAEGQLRYDVALQGGRSGEPAGLRAQLESHGLVLVGERPDVGQTTDAEQARQGAPWSVRGIDLSMDAALERGAARVSGRLFDPGGDLASWKVSWEQLPAERVFSTNPRDWLDAPFRAELRVPTRALEELPASIRPTEIEGKLALALDADGTLRDPRLEARGTLEGFTPASERRRRLQVDVNLDAQLAPSGGRVAITALRRTEPVLKLDAHWTGDARRLAEASDGKNPLLAQLDLSLDEFPMAVLPPLQQRRVRGRLSGKASLQGWGRDARVDLDLRTRELRVERLRLGELHAQARSDRGQIELLAEVDGEAGHARARFRAPLVWGDRLAPSSDGSLEGTLETRELRLGALEPLVEGAVSELDGKLDTELNARIAGGTTAITGHARLREGVLHIPSVGQRFSDIDAELRVTPGALRIEHLKARGLSGGFEASAQATLDGLTPTSAEASLRIKEDDKLPLTVEGESMGDVWGNLQASYRRDASSQTNTLQVKLDKVHVQLPEAPPQGLQELAQPHSIRVGYRRRDGDFTPIALQLLEEPAEPSAETTRVLVDLGRVSVQKGQQAKVELGGKLEATLGEELDVQGRIDAKRGELDISGKTFEIERASVAFTGGKPDDPTIAAVARYDSPEGYSVYAEYTGTVSKGKLALRSEPALSQDEIVTLLLFGTPDGALGAGSQDSIGTAVSVAGSTAAQGLNRAIADVTDLDVTARVDTSTGAARPELVLQLTPRVAAKVTQALGEPVPGQSPDRTFVTIDLRLASHWSLSTMVGDRGASAFDLIWRKRY